MVRAVTFLLAALCFLCSCNDSVKDLQRYQLRGDVDHVEVRYDDGQQFNAFFGRSGMLDSVIRFSPNDTLRHIYIYDRKGLLEEIQVLHTDGSYEALYEYEYQKGILSSYTISGIDMQVLYRWDFEIQDGKAVGCRTYNEGVPVSMVKYSYDSLDKTETVFTPEGELLSKTTYRYAAPGMISSIEGDGFGISIVYNDENLPVRSLGAFIGPDGEIYSNEVSREYGTIGYEYVTDAEGNWTERTEVLGEAKAKGTTIRRKIIYR